MAEPADRQPGTRRRRPDPSPALARRAVVRGLVLGGAGLVVAACGVPSGGKPHVDGDGPSSGGPSGAYANMAPPSPRGIADPQEFVRTFLTAVAGPSAEESRKAAIANAKTFLTSAAQSAWQPDPKQVTVVRVASIGTPAAAETGLTLQVDLVPVGQLTASGSVSPSRGNLVHAKFHLVTSGTGNWLIDTELPPVLTSSQLLSSEGLGGPLYAPQLIYFWDVTGTGLVSDLRYLPSVGLTHDGQPTEILKWLIDGPSDWLAPAVNPLPAGTTLDPANVVPVNGEWVVGFGNLQNVDLARVSAQVHWSLLPDFPEPVRLQVASQDKTVDRELYMTANLADTPARSSTSGVGYFIVNGQVREARAPLYSIPPVFAKINDPTVVSAALSRDLSFGALVRTVKGGKLRLSIGKLTGSAGGSGADFQDITSLPDASSMSRPVWLPVQRPRLLVAADKKLYTVNLARQVSSVTIGLAVDYPVTAFAVAPDGRRIALISGDTAAVATLTFISDNAVVGTPQPIDTGGLTDLTAVAWSRLHCLALAGRSGKGGGYGLIEVTVDGAIATTLYTRLFESQVTQLACYPPLTGRNLRPQSPGPIMVQTLSSGAKQVTRDNAEPLVYQPVQPSPSASAGGTTSTGKNVVKSPFYLD